MKTRRSSAAWLLFVPVLVGLAVMLAAGAPLSRWGVQLASALLGWFVYLILRRLPAAQPRRDGAWLGMRGLAVPVGFVATSLLASGIDGVQRWHVVGPLRLHCSALVTPLLIVVAAGLVRTKPLATALLLTAGQLVHVAQPDAGQATALGVAAAWLLIKAAPSPVVRGLGVVNAALAAAAWLRLDPLPPASLVEDIVAVAFRLSPCVGLLALLSMVPLALVPLTLRPPSGADRTVHHSRIALAFYLTATIIVPLFGEFPVPLLGFGPSPLVGAFLGLAVLDNLAERMEPAHDRTPTSPTPSRPSSEGHRIIQLPEPAPLFGSTRLSQSASPSPNDGSSTQSWLGSQTRQRRCSRDEIWGWDPKLANEGVRVTRSWVGIPSEGVA